MKLSLTPLRLVAAAVALFAVACGNAESTTDGNDSAQEVSSDETSAKATVTFDANYGESVDGTLRQGGTLVVDYDASRLSQCRDGANDGSAGWTITGFAKSAGKTQSFYVAGHASDSRIDENDPPKAKIELESAGDLELWFQVTSLSGCNGYDSNEGGNYHFDVAGSSAAAAKIVYGANGSPTLSGKLVKGSSVHVEYDRSRLENCSNKAGVYVAYTQDGSEKQYVDVKSGAADIQLTRAGTLAMWFETNDQYGCHDTDSNDGANYTFDVSN
jgi:ribosome-binding protein aMBF1 (putative translation factor)